VIRWLLSWFTTKANHLELHRERRQMMVNWKAHYWD